KMTAEADLDPIVAASEPDSKDDVSTILERVDWNSELIRDDLGTAVRELKEQSVTGLAVRGVTLPLALAELGLIYEFEFVIHPCIAGRGPSLFAGPSDVARLERVGRTQRQAVHPLHTYR